VSEGKGYLGEMKALASQCSGDWERGVLGFTQIIGQGVDLQSEQDRGDQEGGGVGRLACDRPPLGMDQINCLSRALSGFRRLSSACCCSIARDNVAISFFMSIGFSI